MTSTIFIIEGNTNIEKLKNEMTKYSDCKLYALNYAAHKNLDQYNIPHEIAEDLLRMEDRRNIDDKSIDITKIWHEHELIKKFLVFQEINLGSLIEMELLHYFIKIYGDAAMINTIIEKENPKLIISHTFLSDYLQRICENKNIQVFSHNIRQPSSQFDKINIKYNVGSYPISITISKNTFIQIKNFFNKSISLIFKLKPEPNKIHKKSILLLDFDPVKYNILIKELSNLDKNILLLNQRRPAIWNLQSFKIVKNSNCKIIHLQNFEKNIHEKIKSEIQILESNLEKMWSLDSVFEEIFSIFSFTLWYSIKESFMQICNSRFQESVQRILLASEMFNTFNLSVIFEWAESAQEEKEIIFLSKKRNVKSILLQHATDLSSVIWDKYNAIVINGYTHFISDKQALWGPQVKKRALTYGNKEENLLVTGSPRHDDFFKSAGTGKSKGIILFATTAVTGRISFEQIHLDAYIKFESFVREVCRLARKFPDKQLIVKPHPQPDSLSNITKIIKEVDPSIPILYNASLIELINSCDLLITFNNSTVVLESMILGKPAISLQIEKWTEEDQLTKSNAFLSISKIEEIESGMKKILYDKDYTNQLYENSKKYLNSSIANHGIASHEVAKLLDSF
ncbi:MAG TPA: hypothetical protein VEU72_03145 [Nitrosopumilaceae archaeon]|nr:hypothetical protein [Nitrosopumilaceae archaeon]